MTDMIDYPRGFTKELMWQAVKDITEFSHTMSSESLKTLANLFEERNAVKIPNRPAIDIPSSIGSADVQLSLQMELNKGHVTDCDA